MTLLVGLGNPGERYRATRHNLGFLVVDEVGRRRGAPAPDRRGGALVARLPGDGPEVVLAWPLTYMNRCGRAVAALLEQAGAGTQDLLVVCDDLYLDFGAVRLRRGGSHGGHNGLRSIIETLGSGAFPRLRIGVGPPGEGVDHADFVLAPFGRAEGERLSEVVGLAADCAEMALDAGIEPAMNRFNRRPSGGAAGDGEQL